MPELPEVETTMQGIKPHVDGARIKSLIVRQQKLRYRVSEALCDGTLAGGKIQAIRRRAKYILLELEAGHVLIHLGMSGVLRVFERDIPTKKHDHIDMILSNGKILRFNDPRRFGCFLWIEGDIAQHKLLASLGPEPLSHDFTADEFYQMTKQSRQNIKTFIMNSQNVVGVGNIYASEALFLAGIHPQRQAASLVKKQATTLVEAIKTVLANAIAAGGTTLKDFTNTEGKPGYFKQALQVYKRDGDLCLRCDNTIKSMILNQRNTFFCPGCQH